MPSRAFHLPTSRAARRRRPPHGTSLGRTRGIVWTTVMSLIGLLAVGGMTVATSTPASAAPGNPVAFDPATPAVFMSQAIPGDTNNTILRKLSLKGDNSFTWADEGGGQGHNYNALAFNTADNFLYAVVNNGKSWYRDETLIRIGQGGTTQFVADLPARGNLTYNLGAFDGNGRYVVGSSQSNDLWSYNLNSPGAGPTHYTISGVGGNFGTNDIVWKDGYFWGAKQNGKLVRIDLGSESAQELVSNMPNGADYGGAWLYGNGNLGFSNNDTGQVYELALSGGATVVSSRQGPVPGSSNDGTAIPGIPTDLGIEKIGLDTIGPGQQVDYTLRITNHGPGNVSDFVVTDRFQDGLSNPQSSTPGCHVNGQDVVCALGFLAAGSSYDVSVTGTVASTIPANGNCPSGRGVWNQAWITSQVDDQNPDNDYAEKHSCAAPKLELSKSSNATPNTRPGDVVTWTIHGTNVGSADFAAQNPARIEDELAGALDDSDLIPGSLDSSLGADPTVSGSRISWSGALKVGSAVELTYQATMKRGGDRHADNIAWEPPGTGGGPPPDCSADNADCKTVNLPALSIEKTANLGELNEFGQELTYTIKVTNLGPGVYTAQKPASLVDDLTDVFDDAELVPGSVTSDVGDAPTINGNELNWSGALASQQVATISYTVAYNGLADKITHNKACVPEEEVPPGAEWCDDVTIPGSFLQFGKESVPSADPLMEGDTVQYTLWFDNTLGKAKAKINHTDALDYVADDADVTTAPVAVDGDLAANIVDGDIHVTGFVPPGERYTVTYTITIRPDGQRGDNRLENHLLPPGDTIPPEPGTDCEETQTSTCIKIFEADYTKSVVASDDPIEAGTALTYTVKVENVSEISGPVDREDLLTDVLDDADLTVDPASDVDSVTVSPVEDEKFAIGGTIEPKATALITYEVTVKNEVDRGNNMATNFVLPPGTPPPATPPGEDYPPCAPDFDIACTQTPLPDVRVAKLSDPRSNSKVLPGDVISYTLTFTNVGQAIGKVDYVDDLSKVLDDADLTTAPVASDPALTVSDGADGKVVVGGLIDVGQEFTVTYAVTPRADGERGDNDIRNVVMKGNGDPCAPADDAICKTNHRIPEIVGTKSVDPVSGTPVATGRELKYTLLFTNIGTAKGDFERTDDLSALLDDARVIVEPVSSKDAVTVTRKGQKLLIAGSLGADGSARVTYTVVVKSPEDRGDEVLANFLLKPGEVPPGDPMGPCRKPSDTATCNPAGEVNPLKSSDPESGVAVEEGQRITYTLSFENVGEVPGGVDYVDYLGGVLDDADLVGELRASGDLAAEFDDDDNIVVTGSVKPGRTATVKYTVVVRDASDRGDSLLDNYLVSPLTHEGPPSTCLESNPLCTEHQVSPDSGLPDTGTSVSPVIIGLALALLAAGGVVVAAARRREE